MVFTETQLQGSFIIDPELFEDEHGFFTLFWSQEEFGAHGLNARMVLANSFFNRKKGTPRGMSFQFDGVEAFAGIESTSERQS